MWLATWDIGADLSKGFSKKVLEIVLDTEFLAPSTVLDFGKEKRQKPLLRLGFQRFLSSDIFDYFAVMSDFGESLENRLGSRPRGFESHTLRQQKRNFCLPKVPFLLSKPQGWYGINAPARCMELRRSRAWHCAKRV